MIQDDIDAGWCLEQLETLIRIPSPTGEEEKVGEWIGSVLEMLQFKVEYQPVETRRRNVVGRRRFGREGPSILVGGHLDTVRPTANWSRDPFAPIVEEGKVFGLGACDMKGGIAALLTALKALTEADRPLRGEILFAGLVDEEALSKGAKAFITGPIDAEMAILAEPHFDEIVIGSPGKVLLQIQIEGMAGHASHPKSGTNAIAEAARLITRLQELPCRRDDAMGAGTHCVLRIQGGPEAYSLSIPETCSFEWSRHLVPSEDADVIVADVRHLADEIGLKGCIMVKRKEPYYPPYVIVKDERIIRILQDAYRDETSTELKVGYGKSVSDANLLVHEAKIPTVLFGPHGGNIHSADEYVLIDSLIAASRIYGRVFEELFARNACG